MEKAIKKAIEGGWKPVEIYLDSRYQNINGENELYFITRFFEGGHEGIHYTDAEILLDPLFWQALGKAEGWKGNGWNKKPLWLNEWHSFIDHIASGKDIDSFFNSLIK